LIAISGLSYVRVTGQSVADQIDRVDAELAIKMLKARKARYSRPRMDPSAHKSIA
jgi:hypothetical protein